LSCQSQRTKNSKNGDAQHAKRIREITVTSRLSASPLCPSPQDDNLHTTSFTYDAFGRVTKTTFPSGYVETYGYDANNNLTNKIDGKNQSITKCAEIN
jgi:YD repeat-containing protein